VAPMRRFVSTSLSGLIWTTVSSAIEIEARELLCLL